MHSKNLADKKYQALKDLFPNAITETKDENGEVVRAIDKDVIMQEISTHVVEGKEERYQFTWPDKKKAILNANAPINKTLRPCREESVNFDETENLYIEGDNLEVLKLLQETYLGKVDLIYLDPPYNTGTDILYTNDYYDKVDEFNEKYELDSEGNRMYLNSQNDGRFHTNWLNMMYERIKLSRSLIKESGFFLIAIDDNELANLIEICDEIFGYKNRLAIITVVHKPEGRNQAKFIGPSNEFMIVYAKDETKAKLQQVVLDEDQKKNFAYEDKDGAYRLKNFIRLSDGKYATRSSKPNFWYPIYVSQDLNEVSLNSIDSFIPVYPITETGVERTWKTTPDTFIKRYRRGDIVIKKTNDKITIYEKLREKQVIKTHWISKKYHGYHYGTKILDKLLEVKTFDFPKSIFLMEDIVKLFCPKDGVILDYFSGSSTTAHATMNVNLEDEGNRRFIMAQIRTELDKDTEAYKVGYKTIAEIGKERLRRAGKQIFEENKDKNGIENLDIGFRVLKTDSSNMKDVYYSPTDTEQSFLDDLEDNIKEDRTPEDLLFQVMLDLGVSLSSKIESQTIAGKEVFVVEDGFLIACFDKDVSEDTVKEIAKKEPYYAVLRDKSMASDSVAANFDQIFASISPETIRKVI